MSLKYLPVHFECHFDSPARADNNLLFVLRSVLGFRLRKMCCISVKSKCSTCMFNQTCVYASFFETIIDKSNGIVPGRDTASHPFAFTQSSTQTDNHYCLIGFDFTITLFGKAIAFLPYIYAAFVQAGQGGIFHDRTTFSITDVSVGERSILRNENQIQTDMMPFIFDENEEISDIPKEIAIKLLSPLRFQVGGRYTKEFSAAEFLTAVIRRYRTMMALYGENYYDEEMNAPSNISFSQSDLQWCNQKRYSARQQQTMKLCGLIGTLTISGDITADIVKLIKFGKTVNLGKNTNFGFGQIDYKMRY